LAYYPPGTGPRTRGDIPDAEEELGRNPDECKILFGVQPIVGRTEAEAREKQDFHNRLVPLEAGLAILSSHLDFDVSRLPLDDLMASLDEPGIQRMTRLFRAVDGTPLTVREVAQRHGQSVGLPQIVGTAEQIADQLEAYLGGVGGDGFMLSAIYCPGAIEEFVDLVVPVLQKRGLFRQEYAGTTQRDHLRQDD
jgi:alkanesulfonate monooxygenase SsuD/methylene tetrahydromethanopterin reductase-like flavin-dependent oxidoreductase (luciferase family)